jgi:hypothetical protein
LDANIFSLTLTDNHADDVDLTEALDNVKLYNNKDEVIATATVTKDKVTFNGLNIDLLDGSNVNLVVKADTIYL